MNKLLLIFLCILSLGFIVGYYINASAQQIPSWIQDTAGWWSQGLIPDEEFLNGIQYLVDQEIIQIEATSQTSTPTLPFVPNWIKDTAGWWASGRVSDTDFVNALTWLIENGVIIVETERVPPEIECLGNAKCFAGTVTEVIDGDTIRVDGNSVRFALASAPELHQFNGPEARELIESICPVGSIALVDEDDGQTEGSYGRIIALIHCNDFNLNEELLDSGLGEISVNFCYISEFGKTDWAFKHGCLTSVMPEKEPVKEVPKEKETEPIEDCDPSYPDFCIPPPPPDLDCADIPQKRFTVLPPDPHRFDGDKDGIGCET